LSLYKYQNTTILFHAQKNVELIQSSVQDGSKIAYLQFTISVQPFNLK